MSSFFFACELIYTNHPNILKVSCAKKKKCYTDGQWSEAKGEAILFAKKK